MSDQPATDNFSIQQLLHTMVQAGASDLHITTGTPPQIRVNGQMTPIKMRTMLPSDTKHICYSILTEAQKRKFEENKSAIRFEELLRDRLFARVHERIGDSGSLARTIAAIARRELDPYSAVEALLEQHLPR